MAGHHKHWSEKGESAIREIGGRLTADERKEMPASEFAGPNHSFPVNDKKHARMALSGATRSERAGNISPAQEASIKAKARAKLKG